MLVSILHVIEELQKLLLLVVLIIIGVISLMKNINESNITDKLNKLEVSMMKELGSFKNDINHSMNDDFTKLSETVEKRLILINDRVNERLDQNFDKTNKNEQYISPYCDFYNNNSDKITSTTKETYFNQNKVKVKHDTACITDAKFSYIVAGDITIKISINEVLFVKKLGKISFNFN